MTASLLPAVLLNLDRDTVRLEHMKTQTERSGLSFTRLPGILGDAVPEDLKPFFFHADGSSKTSMKRGEVGCYASHLRALTQIANGMYGQAVLVMEDDLEIAPDAGQKLQELVALVPEGWDLVRLSCPPRRAFAPIVRLDAARSIVRYSKIPNSAGAYLVTPIGAQKFLDKGVRGLTFDDDLRRPWFHQMNTYGVVSPLMKAGVLKSTIDSIEAGRFDKGISSRRERIMRGDHFHALRRVFYNMRFLGLASYSACMLINIADMISKPFLKETLIFKAARLFPQKSAR